MNESLYMRSVVITSPRKKSKKKKLFFIVGIIVAIVAITFSVIRNAQTTTTPSIISHDNDVAAPIEPSASQSKANPTVSSSAKHTGKTSSIELSTSDNTAPVGAGVVVAPTKTNQVIVTKSPLAVFRNGAEQILMMTMVSNPEIESPPLPSMSEEQLLADFKASFTNDIIVYDDDPPEVVARKETLYEGLMQVKDIIDKGGSVRMAIAELANYNAEGIVIRQQVMEEYRRIEREEGLDAARKYLADANEELVAGDIQPIVILSKDEKRALHRQKSKEKRERKMREME